MPVQGALTVPSTSIPPSKGDQRHVHLGFGAGGHHAAAGVDGVFERAGQGHLAPAHLVEALPRCAAQPRHVHDERVGSHYD